MSCNVRQFITDLLYLLVGLATDFHKSTLVNSNFFYCYSQICSLVPFRKNSVDDVQRGIQFLTFLQNKYTALSSPPKFTSSLSLPQNSELKHKVY